MSIANRSGIFEMTFIAIASCSLTYHLLTGISRVAMNYLEILRGWKQL